MKIVAGELAVVAMIGVGMFAVVRGASGADRIDRFEASPAVTLFLDNMPADMADHYRYAVTHVQEFT